MGKIVIMRKFIKDDSGQALVEYILLFGATIGILALMKKSLKTITVRFWTGLAKKVAAPCPTCDAGADFDL